MFCVESFCGLSNFWRNFFLAPAKDSKLALEAIGILEPSARHAGAT